MAENSKISWLSPTRADGSLMPGHTANLWSGCEVVHTGCDEYYARKLSHRWGNDLWGNDKPRKAGKGVWADLARFQKQAAAMGEMHRVFVGSMMDIFEKPMPVIDALEKPVLVNGEPIQTDYLRSRLFNEVIPNSPNLDFLLLTKRPSNINKYIPESWKTAPPQNVMFGTSIVNLATTKNLVGHLLKVAGRKFLSMEPQIAYIPPFDLNGIDWVIQGGESDSKALRPFEPDWADVMRLTCEAQGVAYFFKQTGTALARKWELQSSKGDNPAEWPQSLRVQQFPKQYLNDTAQ